MTRQEIERALSPYEPWKQATEEAKESFCAKMKMRRYGLEPLINAFAWFIDGWNSAGQLIMKMIEDAK